MSSSQFCVVTHWSVRAARCETARQDASKDENCGMQGELSMRRHAARSAAAGSRSQYWKPCSE
jgi:hypothetical protein